MDSIFLTIKKMLGVDRDFDGFDTDIIIGINSSLMNLNQIGVGPVEAFIITGQDETWSDFLESTTNLEGAKMYVYLKTRLSFDPPSNSFLVEAINKQISELEWRLNTQVEHNTTVL